MPGIPAVARQQVAGQGAAQPARGAAPDPEWSPSRFFDAWKKRVGVTEGFLTLQYMQYCRGMPPDVRKRAIDNILRGTMQDVYVSPDRDEAFDAMDNDIDAMREYAAAFLDKFWKEYWADFLARHPPPEPDDRRAGPPTG